MQAHEWTDQQIAKLQRDFVKVYKQASTEMGAKVAKQLTEFEDENTKWKQRVKKNPELEKEYHAWLKSQAAKKRWIKSMTNAILNDALRADQIASELIYNTVPYVVAENANRAAYAIQEGVGRKINEFTLYDTDTIRYLISEEPQLLPEIPQPKLDKKKATLWNRQRLSNAITQSVLQGESIPDTAKRLSVLMGMNRDSSIRAARTAMTGAENAGRLISYERAQNLGIKLEQQWLATLDERTRTEHRLLDGQHVPVGEKFHVPGYGSKYDIEFPGDPKALPAMVWNCRCTLIPYFDDAQSVTIDRWQRLPEGMTYEKWKQTAPKYKKVK